MTRRGFTMIETVVALAVSAVVLGMLYAVVVGIQRTDSRNLTYGSTLEAAISVSARLRLDMASAEIPYGFDGTSGGVTVSSAGDRLSFARAPSSAPLASDPLAEVVDGGVVTYAIEARPDGTRRLRRDADDQPTTVWEDAPVEAHRFRVARSGSVYYLVVELLLTDRREGGPADGGLPIRLVMRLRTPPNPSAFASLIPGPEGAFPSEALPGLLVPDEEDPTQFPDPVALVVPGMPPVQELP